MIIIIVIIIIAVILSYGISKKNGKAEVIEKEEIIFMGREQEVGNKTKIERIR